MLKAQAVVIAAGTLIGVMRLQPSTVATQQAAHKPNIAVSGCLMRQGYATLIVADAQVDATGDKVDALKDDEPPHKVDNASTPRRWQLENAGVIGQHVGEKVRVFGVSDWAETKGGGPPNGVETGDPSATPPRIEVSKVVVLAKMCS